MSLFDSSNKGVKFANIGDRIVGTINGAPYERQQTKFNTQDPAFWPNGDPMMQILVPLQTQMREDANDDGERTLYVASKNMRKAIGDAIRESGASDLLPGGVLTVQYVGNDPASKNPQNPAKMYTAQYTAPSSAFAQQPAAAAAQQPVQQQQYVDPQQPAFAGQVVPQQAPQQQFVPQQQAPAPVPSAPQPVQQQPQQQAPFAGQQPNQMAAGGLTQEQATQLQQLRSAGIPDAMLQQAMGAVGVTPQMIATYDNTPF